jgi:hypothetical protein
LEGRGRRISEFEASLVYKVSSRTASAIQKNPVSKNQKKKKKKKKQNKKQKKQRDLSSSASQVLELKVPTYHPASVCFQ